MPLVLFYSRVFKGYSSAAHLNFEIRLSRVPPTGTFSKRSLQGCWYIRVRVRFFKLRLLYAERELESIGELSGIEFSDLTP